MDMFLYDINTENVHPFKELIMVIIEHYFHFVIHFLKCYISV